jgi:hypothetical protein
MSDLSTTNTSGNGSGGLVQLDPNKFAGHLERYADEEVSRDWVGQILKFVRGSFKAGRDETVVPIGTRLTVALDTVEVGWERWDSGVLTDSQTGLICEGYSRPDRGQLGDMDRAMWPLDKATGQPKDPWQKVSRVVMYGKKGDESSLYTFITRSYGGIQAVADLCRVAGKEMRMHGNAWPVVALKASSYRNTKHNTMVDVPILDLVDWSDDRWLGAQIRRGA